MPRQDALYQWTRRVATRFPDLPAPTAGVLARYSYGAVLAYVVAAAQWGEHPGGRKTYGHSMIVDPWGEILAEGDEVVARFGPSL
jgi:predicted amidohydrolase